MKRRLTNSEYCSNCDEIIKLAREIYQIDLSALNRIPDTEALDRLTERVNEAGEGLDKSCSEASLFKAQAQLHYYHRIINALKRFRYDIEPIIDEIDGTIFL